MFCTDIRTATFALYVINWLVFITVVESVYCAVRTDSLYKADYVSSLKGQYKQSGGTKSLAVFVATLPLYLICVDAVLAGCYDS